MNGELLLNLSYNVSYVTSVAGEPEKTAKKLRAWWLDWLRIGEELSCKLGQENECLLRVCTHCMIASLVYLQFTTPLEFRDPQVRNHTSGNILYLYLYFSTTDWPELPPTFE